MRSRRHAPSTRHLRLLPLLLLLLLWLGACAQALQDPAADADPEPSVSADRFRSGVQVWGNGVAWNDSLYDLVADYDLFSYMAHNLYSEPHSEHLLDELRSRNPNMTVGAYFQAHGVQDWQIAALQRGDNSYAADWAAFAMSHLAGTTKGDTARSFNNSYLIDITRDGVVEGMVDVLRRWREDSSNDRNGTFVMVDHCSVPLVTWLSGPWDEQTEGELDLDGDGVAHLDDPDEQEILREAYGRLVDELHRVLPDVKVVVNGDLVRKDADFRSRVDGMYIEGGFRWGWGDRYFEKALLEPGPENLWSMLSEMRDGGYSIYEWKEDYRVGWAVGMFVDNLVPLMAPGHEQLPFQLIPQPGEWDVGRPVGEAQVVDGVLLREFEHGTARLESIHGRTPGAFRFRLTDRDRGVLVDFIEGVDR